MPSGSTRIKTGGNGRTLSRYSERADVAKHTGCCRPMTENGRVCEAVQESTDHKPAKKRNTETPQVPTVVGINQFRAIPEQHTRPPWYNPGLARFSHLDSGCYRSLGRWVAGRTVGISSSFLFLPFFFFRYQTRRPSER
ncbi:hypothetical protein LZ32DRAFT_413771 [Colletotrichum eremochloae]|nr:hypothetical protein LZ32DRAFT_413771 [Colletotrichum eremochloae]